MCSTMWCTQISANEEITLLWGRRFVDAVALESMLLLLAGAAFFLCQPASPAFVISSTQAAFPFSSPAIFSIHLHGLLLLILQYFFFVVDIPSHTTAVAVDHLFSVACSHIPMIK